MNYGYSQSKDYRPYLWPLWLVAAVVALSLMSVQARDSFKLDQGLLDKVDSKFSLVTLAACRSASGVLAVGEGVTGLTQAFLFAGGTCVLASQADIGDEYSRRFMLAFYEHLRRGESASRTIAQAAPTRGGRYTLVQFYDEFYMLYGMEGKTQADLNNKLILINKRIIYCCIPLFFCKWPIL